VWNKPAPPDWQQRSGVYDNELTLVRLDGSEVHRLAHHRSRRLNSSSLIQRGRGRTGLTLARTRG
jgi:hypothetical protein